MKRKLKFFLLIACILTFSILIVVYWQHLSRHVPINTGNDFYKSHILGGFSVDTPERATKSATEGIQVVFKYGQPPAESSALGQRLQSLHMKVVDGYLSSYLYYYECHRTKVLIPSLVGPGQYCQDDPYPYLSNENALLATIARHLKQEKDNSLIMGYWVLDDWVQWDAGSARDLLIKIHALIQYYTPGRPAICGFGGSIGAQQKYGWQDWVADNFSPQGCDEVGLYIYTSSLPDTAPLASPTAYYWSISAVLPAMFASLQQRGWDITKVPLIGIGQAFGGPIKNSRRYWVTPNAQDIAIQSRSFCAHGASGLVFYAWDDSEFGPTTQTPMNSPAIDEGIQSGIAACKAYWSRGN